MFSLWAYSCQISAKYTTFSEFPIPILWNILANFHKNFGFYHMRPGNPEEYWMCMIFCQKWYNCLWIIEKYIEKLGLLKTIEKLLKDIDIDWNINMKIFNYWTLLKDQYQFFIIVLYCIELYWTQTQMLTQQPLKPTFDIKVVKTGSKLILLSWSKSV